jgi:transposase-like protein
MARDTREVWAKRVERLADSGLSAKEFAAEIGVNANTLAGWKWRLRAGRGRCEASSGSAQRAPACSGEVDAAHGGGSTCPSRSDGRQGAEVANGGVAERIAPLRFIELTAEMASSTTAMPFEITLRSGRTVRVPSGFDSRELARLIGVVEEVRS